MNEIKKRKTFSVNELLKLNSMQGKILANVIYHNWVNTADGNSKYVFIDKLELNFLDGVKIVLNAGEDSDALRIIENYNLSQDILEIEKDFEGKITIVSELANKNEYFADIIGKEISSVQLSKDGGDYLADAIVLEFEKERRLIALSPEEGIIIDYFED